MVITPEKEKSKPVFGLAENKKQPEANGAHYNTSDWTGRKGKDYIRLIPPPKRDIVSRFPVMYFGGNLKGGCNTSRYNHVGQVVQQIASYKHGVGIYTHRK